MNPNIETPNVQQMWHHSLAAEFPQALDMVVENPPFSQMIFPEKNHGQSARFALQKNTTNSWLVNVVFIPSPKKEWLDLFLPIRLIDLQGGAPPVMWTLVYNPHEN